MKMRGFENVYHLKGGILKYLENIPEKESLWDGECFVFDDRVSVKHSLKEGTFEMCHGCRMPLSRFEKQSKQYVKGVACPKCYKLQAINKKKDSKVDKSKWNLQKKEIQITSVQKKRF